MVPAGRRLPGHAARLVALGLSCWRHISLDRLENVYSLPKMVFWGGEFDFLYIDLDFQCPAMLVTHTQAKTNKTVQKNTDKQTQYKSEK